MPLCSFPTYSGQKQRYSTVALWRLPISKLSSWDETPLTLHLCVTELGNHWFRWWLVACSAPEPTMTSHQLHPREQIQ